MSNNKIILSLICSLITFTGLTSCEDFLSTLPDNRTEIASITAAKELLTSAYTQSGATEMAEMMSDNVTDNGPRYSTSRKLPEECYKWQDPTETVQDSPNALWSNTYNAIAASNHVLEFIKDQAPTDEINAIKGEALICRAYNHFLLATVFCQYYNPVTSSSDLGIPYIDRSDVPITEVPDRETVQITYSKINADIEAGLPLIDDTQYEPNVIKYHFNKAAAYAFGARFNLYYGNYKKAVEYANVALGKNPVALLRDYSNYLRLSSYDDFSKYYVKPEEACNFLLQVPMSNWSSDHWPYVNWYRYTHNRTIAQNQTVFADGPWGGAESFYPARFIYGNGDAILFLPKLGTFFEITDIVAQTGYPHTVNTIFTADETLLTRAEAHILLGDYPKALNDLQMWCKTHTNNAFLLEAENIEKFYGGEAGTSYVTPQFNTNMIGVNTQDAKMMQYLYCVLHFRRLETIHEGLRWFDIKRYGIEVRHPLDSSPDLILKSDDPRRVIQIPADVISAGLVPNPR